jgi:hypothetical protein
MEKTKIKNKAVTNTGNEYTNSDNFVMILSIKVPAYFILMKATIKLMMS